MDINSYQSLYNDSIQHPSKFWLDAAEKLSWIKHPTKGVEADMTAGDISWFADGTLNVCYNCVDRHLETHGDKTALIWESDDGAESKFITYQMLHEEVCKFTSVLKKLNVTKGERICIYMPMIPEAIYAMLACARIGAIHSVVFAGFSAQSLATRLDDAECSVLITADVAFRGGKQTPLKAHADNALQLAEKKSVHHMLVVNRGNTDSSMQPDRDYWYHNLVEETDIDTHYEVQNAEDPLFILYTSGSTGKPKGVMHTQAGYLLYASVTHDTIFGLKDDDVYWCSADVGWITGHSYIVYGPLANAATVVIYEGVPNYPTASRCWEIIDKYDVTIFYTAPTAIRALMREGDEFVKTTSRQSLRVLGTVGEPINPEAWRWYHEVVGEKRCDIVDTWWQTETGGMMITPIAGCTPLKAGSASLPFFGVEPALLDDDNNEIKGPGEGKLVMKRVWPGMMRGVYNHQQRFIDTYFAPHPGYYTSGDKARRDEDGYYWITGRIDDVINVSGHRLSTAEIESALVSHPKVAEAAVIGTPHDIKGETIFAFVTLIHDVNGSDELMKALKQQVRHDIGPIATPEKIIWAKELPKTRSGKIMRRLLRELSKGDKANLGDTSTLADPSVVSKLQEALAS